MKRNEAGYRVGKEEIPAEGETKAVKQKVYAEGQNGAGGKLQDLPVNAERILDGVEVTFSVVIDVNGFDGILHKGDAFFRETEEHIHLIFITFSGNGQKLRNHFPGKTPESCLGVLKLYTGGEKKYFFGNIVAYAGAYRRVHGLQSCAKKQAVRRFLSFLEKGQGIFHGMLSIGIHGNHLKITVHRLEIG